MNTIKQAKHLNDAILGRYGTMRIWRSGVNSDGIYTWSTEIAVNGKTYLGWATSEEESRTQAAQNYKEGKWEIDNTTRQSIRYDKSKLIPAILLGENDWWRVVQDKLVPGSLVEKDEKQRQFTISVELPEPIKNMLLMIEIFKVANNKLSNPAMKLNDEQIEEYVKHLYPILSYSGLWADHIPTEELDDFYGIEHIEAMV